MPYRKSDEPIRGYVLENFLGKGTLGETWQALVRSGTRCAIRFVRLAEPRAHRELRGISYIKNVRHPNLVEIQAVWLRDQAGQQFSDMDLVNSRNEDVFDLVIIMEYIDGESISQRIACTGPIPEPEAIRLIVQVAKAVQHAHSKQLIIRDVKPESILVTKDAIAKLRGLGLVEKIGTGLNLTRTGSCLGTPHFMAPEQFKDASILDERSDIYALGATLYVMVTGKMPFKSRGPLDAYMKKTEGKIPPPREIVRSISEGVDWAIRRSLHADPKQRPVDCRQFIEDLTGAPNRRSND